MLSSNICKYNFQEKESCMVKLKYDIITLKYITCAKIKIFPKYISNWKKKILSNIQSSNIILRDFRAFKNELYLYNCNLPFLYIYFKNDACTLLLSSMLWEKKKKNYNKFNLLSKVKTKDSAFWKITYYRV